MPRRAAWVLFLAGAIFGAIEALHDSGVSGIANWFGWAAVAAIGAGAAAWTFPGQPPRT